MTLSNDIRLAFYKQVGGGGLVECERPERFGAKPFFILRGKLALPVVSETELIDIFKLVPHEAKNGKKVPMTFGDTTPLLFFHATKQCYYTDVPYKSASDEMEEIDEKEFYRRWGAARNMA